MCPINIRRLRILQHLEDILQNQIPILQIPMLTLFGKDSAKSSKFAKSSSSSYAQLKSNPADLCTDLIGNDSEMIAACSK
jgi:hypothetical protein